MRFVRDAARSAPLVYPSFTVYTQAMANARRQRILGVMSGESSSPLAGVARAGLSILEPGYYAAIAARGLGYHVGLKRSCPLGRPTVSVGNLTTGGTGKTPMVQHLARHLADQGHRPCILLRGYRGGDEAQEHQLVLGELALVRPNPDRVAEARAVLAEHPDTTCFILDDGFQHRRARRDLDLVLLDATNPWGHGHLLPRGLMREPKAAIRRADAILITRTDQATPETVRGLDDQVRAITGKPPLAHTEHCWSGLIDANGHKLTLDHLAGLPVMAVVAIGNPQAFEQTLQSHAGAVVHCEALPDHHGYTTSELHRLCDLAQAAGAKAIVTTQKDWVKWSLLLEDQPLAMPVLRVELALGFREGESALCRLVTDRLGRPVRSPK
jgi:tetraacyldisaccharide 4'-kinase